MNTKDRQTIKKTDNEQKSVRLSDKQSERQINGQTDEQKEGRR